MRFWKGHALGNDYIVLKGAEPPAAETIRQLCDRYRGIGSDGILLGDVAADPVRLRIFNPDGTEAEKSGNGLRIFGAWLHLRGLVPDGEFEVALPGETVRMRVLETGPGGERLLSVAMGVASFRAGDVGYTGAGAAAEVLGVPLEVAGETVPIHLVSLGNPHCVALVDVLTAERFRRLAPAIQSLPEFSRGVNVQIARVAGPSIAEAMVWERGAGETEASGSSACAVAAAALRVGALAERDVTVRMPGGELRVEVDDEWRVTLTGPAVVVYEGKLVDGHAPPRSPAPSRPG